MPDVSVIIPQLQTQRRVKQNRYQQQSVVNMDMDKQLQRYRSKAESLIPTLHETTYFPLRAIKFSPDKSLFLRYRAQESFPISGFTKKLWKKGDDFILDFGSHQTGYLHFDIGGKGKNVGDSPIRLRLTFGEVPADVVEELNPATSKSWISTGWYPDEIVNIDDCPSRVSIPRRFAFRYVRIQVLTGNDGNYQIRFNKLWSIGISSVTALPESIDGPFAKIDQVSMVTLRDCMTTIFEDGPRRDRRLWLGDLRLQALTNYVTTKNYDLVKRCLYLFAGFPGPNGQIMGCVFERPTPRSTGEFVVDYNAFFVVTVYEYVVASGDTETGRDLWPAITRSMDCATSSITNGQYEIDPNSWIFFDWEKALDRTLAIHALVVHAMKIADRLAMLLGQSPKYANMVRKSSATIARSYDSAKGCFVSGPDQQISWTSQAFAAMAQVLPNSITRQAIISTMNNPNAIKPRTPYAYHYVAEALARSGAKKEAKDLVSSYWGGMVERGADTFWEAYDPTDSTFSPYDDHLNNSYCHAWSCTPSWFLRSGILDEQASVPNMEEPDFEE